VIKLSGQCLDLNKLIMKKAVNINCCNTSCMQMYLGPGSSAQRLMSRRLKSTISCPGDLLKCQQFNGSLVKNRFNQRRQQQKLECGDVVRMQTPKGYNQLGFVVRAAEQLRSFVVRFQSQEYRRNRRHLLKVPEQNPRWAYI
jgi:hypothetical protein